MSQESVPPLSSEILYNNTSGQTAGNRTLTLDTLYNGTRLTTANMLVENLTNLNGNVGIRTATPRGSLEVTGQTILTAKGSASQRTHEFGLNGAYDSLSLISPVGLGLNGTTSIFFGMNSLIYYPVARIAAVDNGNYSGSLSFQIGQGEALLQQLRLTTSGVFTNGAAFLYASKTLPSPGTNLCLNFPAVNDKSTSVIDIYVTFQQVADPSIMNMVKFTAFIGTNLYVTGISVQSNNATYIIKPNGVKASGSKVTLTYSDTANIYMATVNYMIYGPASFIIGTVDITLNDSGITTAPGTPTGFTGTPGNQQITLTWSSPSNGGSAITGYTIYTSSGLSLDINGTIDANGFYVATLTSDALVTLLITNLTLISSTKVIITGLTNGTPYTIGVKAKNSIGYSGVTSVTVIPAVVPDPPTGVSAVPGNTSATVSWSAPSFNGASAIISYKITSFPGALVATSTSVTPTVIYGLTNGVSYTFTVVAKNSIGDSNPSSASSAIVPVAVPDAPSIISVTTSVGSATVNWTAPASNGGSAIISYSILYTTSNVTTTVPYTANIAVSSSNTTTISGLLAGSSYSFRVIVKSNAGDSAPSAFSSSVTIPTAPDIPTDVSAAAGVNSAVVTWTAPISNGGSPITSYTIYYTTGGVTSSTVYTASIAVSSINTTTVTPLTAGTSYTFTVAVTNAVGSSSESSASGSITTPSVPGVPTSVVATAGFTGGSSNAVVTWVTPTSTGGSAILGYKIYDSLGKIVDSSGNLVTDTGSIYTTTTATTITVQGLTNATAYTFTAKAVNAVGASVASSGSSITTATNPGPPTSLSAVSGTNSATLSWTAPASTGGSEVTGYKIYDSLGKIIDSSGNAVTDTGSITTTNLTSMMISSLTNGVAYVYTIKTANAIGSSTSATFPSVTPGLPTAPLNLTAISGSTSTILSWSAPASTGGSPITGYKVNDSSGNMIYNGSSSISTTTTITGLTNGSTYTYTVVAINANGTSAASLPVTVLVGLPGAITGLTAVAGNQSVTLSWTAPVSGSTGYKIYDISGNIYDSSGNPIPDDGYTYSVMGLTVTYSGLTNGISYTYTVYSCNSYGRSSLAAAITVTPGLPGPPTSLTGYAGNTTVTLSWTAPTNTGGSPITSYSISYGGTTVTSAVTTATINGLTNGTTYLFNVNSVNANGTSLGSSSLSLKPFTIPSAPLNLSATLTSTTAVLSWTAPPSGGLTILGYKIYDSSGNIYDSSGNVVADTGLIYSTSMTTYTISGLSSGVSYVFTVKAASAAGISLGSSINVKIGAPGTPTNLLATPGNGTVTLNWTAPTGSVTSYSIVYSGISTTSASTSKVISGLINGSTYTFSVSATNANGSSLYAASISATPGLPGAPTSLTGSAGIATVTLNWIAPSVTGGFPITGYNVSDSGTTITVSTTTVTITELTRGFPYLFNVTTQNATGASIGSASLSITPL
jgi:titin